MVEEVTVLKRWTGKAHANVIFDSTVDEFTNNGLFAKTRGKPNVAVVGFTTDGDVFGGFYSCAVTKQVEWFNDPNIFAFSFESHGRCMTPQRFLVRERRRHSSYVCFNPGDANNGFVYFGEYGGLGLGDERVDAWCGDLSREFEGLEDTTLSGKNGHGCFHHCTRLLAVQLS